MYSKRVKLWLLLRVPALCVPLRRAVCELPTGLDVPSLRQRTDPISRAAPELSSSNPAKFGRRRRAGSFESRRNTCSSLENGEHLDECLTEDPAGVCLQIDRRQCSFTYFICLFLTYKVQTLLKCLGLKMYMYNAQESENGIIKSKQIQY